MFFESVWSEHRFCESVLSCSVANRVESDVLLSLDFVFTDLLYENKTVEALCRKVELNISRLMQLFEECAAVYYIIHDSMIVF